MSGLIIVKVDQREYKLKAGMAVIEEIEARLDVEFFEFMEGMATRPGGIRSREAKAIFAALADMSYDDVDAMATNLQTLGEIRMAAMQALTSIDNGSIQVEETDEDEDVPENPTQSDV